VITCEDGTSAAIASAGTVITYPEGLLGEVDPTIYPSGEIVVVDADGVILGELAGFSGDVQYATNLHSATGPSILAYLINGPNGSVLFPGGGTTQLLYLDEDCIGTPFAIGSPQLLWLGEHNEYYVMANVPKDRILFQSVRDTSYIRDDGSVFIGTCRNEQNVLNAAPAVPYYPPPEILNAAYPIRAEQLP
jgi:hypothetical protein